MNAAWLAAFSGLVSAGCAAQGPRVRFEKAPGSPVKVGAPAARPGVGDVNGDGLVDLVAAGAAGQERTRLVVLINRGGGRIEKAGEAGAWKDPPNALLGDVNGDKKLDAVATEHDSYAVTVLLGDGRGEFAPAPGSPFMAVAGGTKPHTHGMALADVDADGRPDVLTTNATDGTLSVLLGDGRGGFAPAAGSPFAVSNQEPYDAIAIADFSGDGMVDVAVPLLTGRDVAVMQGDGRGGFGPPKMVRIGARPAFVETADVNGDRRPDLLVSHDDVGMVYVLLGDGRGGFSTAEGSPLRLPNSVWEVSAGDLNGDGHPDLALGENVDRGVVIAVGDGRGGFTAAERIELGGSPGAVMVTDMDGDGRQDIVAAGHQSGEVTVLLQR